ncbi:MAG: hypothetical protein COV67_07535 [Nitrospinae bacterium CG11_big_fil_rev_8_21_14_0_20_56_8]|nr:MAG: hypothetical protein COV67_07535 [Nitrospinae bacterium CG11_big_fil_rev_8_21_14_0_20_56_8]
MKILTVYYKHKPGGFCKRLRMKIEAYLEQGWEVHYIAVEPYPYTSPRLIPHLLPCPFSCHDSPWFWLYFFVTAPLFILFTAYRCRIQLLSIFSPLYASLCIPARRFLNIPLLEFLRSVPARCWPSSPRSSFALIIESALEKWGLEYGDLVLANSESVKHAMIEKHGKMAEKIGILYNNIEEFTFDPPRQRERILSEFSLDENSFIIATTGLLEKRKNLEFLLTGFSRTRHDRSVLLIIGDGKEIGTLKRLTLALNLANRVIFTGWRKDAPSLVQGADLFVFSSSQEGLSNSLLEAMACGIPCLVSGIPENKEVLPDPEHWFSLAQPEQLAEKIDHLVTDPEYYQSLADRTRAKQKRFRFDWKKEVVGRAEQALHADREKK